MNKRNKPASLTSSLLARKGEAEPAIEPYSFLESNNGDPAGSPAGNSAAPVNGEMPINGSTSAETSGESAAMNANPADGPEIGWPEADGGLDPARGGGGGGGGEIPGSGREEARDRRLLRFVYVTAVLTGILAVVIYAGGWFFDTPDSAAEKSAQMASKPPPAGNRKPKTNASGTTRLKRLKASDLPAPPAPVSRARAKPAAKRNVPKPSSSRMAVGAGGEKSASKAAKAAARPPSKPAPVVAQPQAEPPPASLPVKPSPERKAAPKKPAAVAVATPKAPEAPKRSASGRYFVQLGSVTSEAGAQRFWGKVKKKFPDILGEYDLIVEKRVVANRGTFYRVQVGRFATFKDVRGLCNALKARKQGCLPVKR